MYEPIQRSELLRREVFLIEMFRDQDSTRQGRDGHLSALYTDWLFQSIHPEQGGAHAVLLPLATTRQGSTVVSRLLKTVRVNW